MSQVFTCMVASGCTAAYLTCYTHTWALRHDPEKPGTLFVSKVRPALAGRSASTGLLV